MQIELERQGKALTIRLNGRLDTVTSPELKEIVDKELGEAAELFLDMEKVEYVSSAGLRVILAASKKMKAKKSVVTVCHANKEVKEVFEITGFDEILNIQ